MNFQPTLQNLMALSTYIVGIAAALGLVKDVDRATQVAGISAMVLAHVFHIWATKPTSINGLVNSVATEIQTLPSDQAQAIRNAVAQATPTADIPADPTLAAKDKLAPHKLPVGVIMKIVPLAACLLLLTGCLANAVQPAITSITASVKTAHVDYLSYVDTDITLTATQKAKRHADIADFNAAAATSQPTESQLPVIRERMAADVDTINTDTGMSDHVEYLHYIDNDPKRTAIDREAAALTNERFEASLADSRQQVP